MTRVSEVNAVQFGAVYKKKPQDEKYYAFSTGTRNLYATKKDIPRIRKPYTAFYAAGKDTVQQALKAVIEMTAKLAAKAQ